jgi:4-azaleucine resistance transporter AzlC
MDQHVPPIPIRPGLRGLRAGLIAALPVLLAVGPFGLIFGIIATEAGLDLAQTMAMTVTVIAGASQLAALQLLSEDAPALVAILTGAVVNLRMAMYSASLAVWWEGAPMRWRALAAPLLHDQSFALSIARYRLRPQETLADKLGFYFGVGLLTCSVWITTTWIGATVGGSIAERIDLGFIVPVTFIAVAAPMIRGRANVIAALVAAVLALLLMGLPYGLGLLVAATGGIVTGMVLSRRAG